MDYKTTGMPTRKIKHSMERRAPYHDYNAPGTYMLTLVSAERRPIFGTLVDDPTPHILLSPFGRHVEEHELIKITTFYPMVRIWRYCIMPDHIHLIVNVSQFLPKKKHLGIVVSGFKYGCNKAYWSMVEDTEKAIFRQKYNDKLLWNNKQLDGWKRYLEDNPRRLSIKRSNPDYFTVIHNLVVGGHSCQVVGNRFLLDIPDKMAVIVHRSDSDELFERKKEKWLACGERGGVLVGTAIAPREKIVMREAMNRGYSLIWLRENGFPNLYKPSGESFDACAAGLLLEISPNEYHFDRRTITRTQCLALNALVEGITQTQ